MESTQHHRCLENMYAVAPINAVYRPTMTVKDGAAEIVMQVSDTFHHSAGAVHGSVYFKMLDDAAFFAANSVEDEFFVLTSSFTTYLLRPVISGTLRAVGTVVHRSRSQILAEAVVYDEAGKEVGRGNGVFVRGRLRLAEAAGYGDAEENEAQGEGSVGRPPSKDRIRRHDVDEAKFDETST